MHYPALMIPPVSKYLHNHDNEVYANAPQNLPAYQHEQIMQNSMYEQPKNVNTYQEGNLYRRRRFVLEKYVANLAPEYDESASPPGY